MKIYYMLISMIFVSAFSINAQDNKGIITGKVISAMNQKPLQGITVRVEGTNLGAISNAEGKFTVRNVAVGEYAVKFTAVGYATYVKANVIVSNVKPAQLEIELVEKYIQLGEAVVRASYFQKSVEAISSSQILSSEDIRRTPGAQEDVVRATALLPGVAVTQAGRNDLIVRGGAPYENLFIVDNIEVPNINHFGTQGSSGGPLSIINIDFVKNVKFAAGAFGSKYGDRTSSMTNIQLRNGNEEKFGGKVVLSATGFGVNLEGPMYEGSSFLFSARRSYLDLIFKAAGFGFIPEYWDFQGKANFKINDNNYISFLAIGALGSVKLNNEDEDKRYDNSRVAVPNQDQYFSGITWKSLMEKGFLTVTLGETFTKYSTYQNDASNPPQKIFYNNSTEAETSLRTDLDLQLSPNLEFTVGNQLKWASRLEYDILIPGYIRKDNFGVEQPYSVDTNFRAYKNSTYMSLTGTIGDFKLTAGGRAEYFNFMQTKWYFSPRASILYQLNDVSAFTASAGRYFQSPSYIWLIGAENQQFKPIQSDQIVIGYDHTPMEDLKVSLEVFYKVYNNYPSRVYRPQSVLAPGGFEDVSSDIPFGLEPISSTGTGFARGAELFIQKKLSEIPLYGLFSLTVSESKFKSIDGIERPGAYDTRFIMNLAVGYRLDENWEFSSKFRMATGQPTTPFTATGQKDFTQYNAGERLPLFHSLDFRVDKRWAFDNFFLVTYIDIQNLYGRQNVQGYRWDFQKNKIEESKSIGLLPSIGISFEF